MLRVFILMLAMTVFVACNSQNTGKETADTEHDHAHDHDHDHDHDHAHDQEKGDGVHFGDEIDDQGAVDLASVIAKIENNEELTEVELSEEQTVNAVKEVKIEGKVSEVCQAAGCWMKIATEDGTEMFIDTKHKFFMPKDIAGKTVVVKGHAYKNETTVDELRHFAEDKGASKEEIEKITEPKVEYKLLAEGAMLK